METALPHTQTENKKKGEETKHNSAQRLPQRGEKTSHASVGGRRSRGNGPHAISDKRGSRNISAAVVQHAPRLEKAGVRTSEGTSNLRGDRTVSPEENGKHASPGIEAEPDEFLVDPAADKPARAEVNKAATLLNPTKHARVSILAEAGSKRPCPEARSYVWAGDKQREGLQYVP